MILVTGATGTIGRALVFQCLKEGKKVRAHGRSLQALEQVFKCRTESRPAEYALSANSAKKSGLGSDGQECGLEFALADFESLTESQALDLCKGCKSIVHSAGLVHNPAAPRSQYELLNVRASSLLADAAAVCGLDQFVFLSSSSVYGNRETIMVSEKESVQPDSGYAASKIETEAYLEKKLPCPTTIVLRPALVFGEGDRGNMLSLIKQVLGGKYFLVDGGRASKSLIYAQDLACIISALQARELDGFRVFNVANPQPVSMKDLSLSILEAAGRQNTKILSLPGSIVEMLASVANSLLGERSPLSAERLAKLTRNNSISVDALSSLVDLNERNPLQENLAKEISWARTEGYFA